MNIEAVKSFNGSVMLWSELQEEEVVFKSTNAAIKSKGGSLLTAYLVELARVRST